MNVGVNISFCDKCHKEIKVHKDRIRFSIWTSTHITDIEDVNVEWHLCKECAKELTEYLQKGIGEDKEKICKENFNEIMREKLRSKQ